MQCIQDLPRTFPNQQWVARPKGQAALRLDFLPPMHNTKVCTEPPSDCCSAPIF